jgi:hypothetical protein
MTKRVILPPLRQGSRTPEEFREAVRIVSRSRTPTEGRDREPVAIVIVADPPVVGQQEDDSDDDD